MSENPRAFPNSATHYREEGMSLRDWFAGQALVGISSDERPISFLDWAPQPRAGLAALAYEIADAMLAERAKAERP